MDEDQDVLGELGYFPSVDSSDEEGSSGVIKLGPTKSVVRYGTPQSRGAPWFEEMVENTGLGRFKQQRGGHASRDGSVKVEWEVVEWTEGDDEAASPAKRQKIEDTEMGSA